MSRFLFENTAIQCPKCGSEQFARRPQVEANDPVTPPKPGDVINCNGCGHTYTIEQAIRANRETP